MFSTLGSFSAVDWCLHVENQGANKKKPYLLTHVQANTAMVVGDSGAAGSSKENEIEGTGCFIPGTDG